MSFFTNFITNFKLLLIITLAHLNKKNKKTIRIFFMQAQIECKLILVKANYSLKAIF